MMKGNAAIVLSIGAALSTSPASAADMCVDLPLKCNGFEPNWQFTVGSEANASSVVRFIDPENPNWQTEPLSTAGCIRQGGPTDFELNTPAPLSLQASIVEQTCVEPNGDVSGFSISTAFNQGALTNSPNRVTGTGCCVRLD